MIKITTDGLPEGTVDMPYDVALTAEAIPAEQITWTVVDEPPLPPELTLNPATGVISGMCKTAFFSSVTFKATGEVTRDSTKKSLLLHVKDDIMGALTGMVIPYAGKMDEAVKKMLRDKGFLYCDGSPVSRETYKDLFKVIEVLYGGGDGVTTFNLPDYQGQFLRGVSNNSQVDPNVNQRYPQENKDGSKGSASGNMAGSFQGDEFRSHHHGVRQWRRSFQGEDSDGRPFVNEGQESNHTEWAGGFETRPKNVYVHYLVKY